MRLVISVICLLYAQTALALEPSVRFERLTIKDGLSQNSVSAIEQDSRGFMWFGTYDGLNRFDGYQFKYFRNSPDDQYSLSSNAAKVIFRDRNNTLWIGTDKGLNRYDQRSQRFYHFTHKDNDPHSLSHNSVNAIGQDAKGRLWIGTSAGVNQFDASSSQFKQFKHEPSNLASLSHDEVLCLLVDSKDRLWVGTEGGLNRYDSNTGHFVHFKHDPSNALSLSHNKVNSIFEDGKGRLWVGTADGLNHFNPHTQSFVRYQHKLNDRHSLSHNSVLVINEDKQGLLWIGTIDGLNRFDAQNRRFVRYKQQSSELESLSASTVQSIYQDPKGLIWFGTYGGGVNKFNHQNQRFGHFKHNASDPDGLSGNDVWSVFEDSNHSLWIGTRAGGLNKLTAHSDRFEHLQHDPDNPNSLSHNFVRSSVQGAKDMLWIATIGGGLNRYDMTSGRFSHYRHESTNLNSLRSDILRVLYIDKAGMLWLGYWSDGLSRFDAQRNQIKHYKHLASDKNSLSNDEVRTILEDSSGRFWIGTYNGLNLLNRKTGRFTRYLHEEQNPNSISHNHIVHIQQDSSGTIWLATYGGGLNKYDSETDSFTHYRVKDGLPNDIIYGILEDKVGNLWLSTNLGLSKFNPKTERFSNYDVNDGLQSNEFNSGVHFKSTSGEMFFGGVNGFNRFFPQNITDDIQPPKVVFTDFMLFNKSVAIDPDAKEDADQFTLPNAIGELAQLTLGHQQSLVSFEFAALDYRNPMSNRYKYKLEGLDKQWIEVDAKIRRATYTNLSSGDYTLRVKAANPDGYWTVQGASIAIHVNPPPWLSWWAYLIYVLLSAALVFVVLRYRMQKNKLHNERKVLSRLKQVDKLKDAFLANTSHELRTPLNGIIGLAESLLDGVAGALPAKANKNLSMVVTSGKRLSHLINDILDLSKLKHSAIVLKTQPVDLHALTDVVLTLSEPLLTGKDLQLVNAVPAELNAVEADEARLLQIMHNLVGNGIKFTESGSVTVYAAVAEQGFDHGVKVSVTDTGIGISEGKFATIFDSFEQVEGDSDRAYGGTGLGLTITRQLVELHAGSIEVASKPGQGSTFSFTLPLCGAKPQPASKINDPFDANLPSGSIKDSAEQDSNVVFDNVDPVHDGSGFRLLLVDDEPINLQVLNNHLSMQNYQLVEAADGLQALDAIEHNGPFDMVLLDIMMPKLSGYDVCKKIRQNHALNDLPVIFLTAKNQVEDLVRGFEIGANDHLTKPVAKHELLSRVEIHLKMLNLTRNLDQLVGERTEQALLAQQKLVLSDKLASLGTLMAGVAHEINNPTNFVNISVQNLEAELHKFQQFLFDLVDEAGDEDILDSFKTQFKPLYDHLETIKDGTERIKTIVKDLKTSTHMNETDKSTVCVTDTLTSTINLVSAKFKQAVEIVSEFKATPTISCYPAKLSQVYMNLLVNACDALEHQPDGKIVVGCQLLDDHVEITVKDNGCGMTDETKNKLFEPFFTTKGVDKGTGLGLSISYDIVQKHGGELSVESILGQGSVFRLILPL